MTTSTPRLAISANTKDDYAKVFVTVVYQTVRSTRIDSGDVSG
jgi:hypothetical protein